MPADVSHFTMAGFDLQLKDGPVFARQMEAYARACTPETLSGADLVCVVRDPSGAEMWIGLKRQEQGELTIETVNPAFAGEGRLRIEVSGDASDPAWRPHEIAVAARFGGDQIPFVFDLADPRQAALARPGATVDVSLSGFSFDASVFKDEKSYYRNQGRGKVVFAADFFMPSGMFSPEAGGTAGSERPTAYADFAGTVLKSELRTNQAGRGRFWWALVKTYGGATVDVLLDPATVKRRPRPGMVISGRFWLSGRLLPER